MEEKKVTTGGKRTRPRGELRRIDKNTRINKKKGAGETQGRRGEVFNKVR